MKSEVGIDLENIVYYRGETHYFVMTALRSSLIEKGVLLVRQGFSSRTRRGFFWRKLFSHW